MENQSRKSQNKEIERKLKNKKRLSTAIALGIVAVAAILIGIAVWDMQSQRWIMTFEGERIATSEFQFIRDEDALVEALTILNRANQHNISITEEERENLEMLAGMLGLDELQIPHGRMADLMSAWSPEMGFGGELRAHLMNHYVPDYTFMDDEFQEGLADYIQFQGDLYAELQVKYIAHDNMDDIIDISMRAHGGEDFDSLIREFSIHYNAEEGITVGEAFEVIEELDIWDGWMQIMSLQAGEISNVVSSSDGELHVLVYAYSRDDNLDEIEESFRTQFINAGRAEIFSEIIETWVENVDYTIHERTMNRLQQ
ncbi:MAG: hypothetical protein FWE05_08060 [Defluviitaleaceae bacterium]|nr:hypothetical protein [Defluviitaleaceae bacterium]